MPINPDDEESDYALFGMVLLQWGHVEASLINILLRLAHPLFHTYSKENLPGAFGQQVKSAQRLYRAIPQMANLADHACTLLDTLLPADTFRIPLPKAIRARRSTDQTAPRNTQ